MTREEMREKVLAIVNKWPNTPSGAIADAAIAIIRGETLEDAAEAIAAWQFSGAKGSAATRIRALKDKP